MPATSGVAPTVGTSTVISCLPQSPSPPHGFCWPPCARLRFGDGDRATVTGNRHSGYVTYFHDTPRIESPWMWATALIVIESPLLSVPAALFACTVKLHICTVVGMPLIVAPERGSPLQSDPGAMPPLRDERPV